MVKAVAIPSPAKSLLRSLGLRRKNAAAARLWLERNGLSRLPSPPRSEGARILCYHSTGTPTWGVNDVGPRQFRRQLEQALTAGHRFVPAEEIARTGGRPKELAITFDDGLRSVLVNAAPVLTELAIPWTMFVVTEWAEGRHGFGEDVMLSWQELERLAATPGVTLASHSLTHPDFGRIPLSQAVDELGESRRVLASRLGITTNAFAIPLGGSRNWTDETMAAARAAGYEYVYAQSEGRRHPGTIARTFITRFDTPRIFGAALSGAFADWEEWV
jgi:peptidoglycan/xylan/chitin deacetylase (PgdA/CDA1 family)